MTDHHTIDILTYLDAYCHRECHWLHDDTINNPHCVLFDKELEDIGLEIRCCQLCNDARQE